VHHLIAALFVPGRQPGMVINHRDGDKTNNRADNLEWCTPADNARHAKEHGLLDRPWWGQAKIDHEIADILREMSDSGIPIKAIAAMWDLSPRHTAKIVSGRAWAA